MHYLCKYWKTYPVQKNMYGTVTKIGNVHFYCDNMNLKSDRIQRKNILFIAFVFFSLKINPYSNLHYYCTNTAILMLSDSFIEKIFFIE